jgi:hypothetical protein
MIRDRDEGQFRLVSDFKPQGDQPQAIEKLVDGLQSGRRHQVLLGVTGSGKTFTMAHVIARVNRPTLVIAPNKTLAAQLQRVPRAVSDAVRSSSAITLLPARGIPSFHRHLHRKTPRSTIDTQLADRRRCSTPRHADRGERFCIYGLGSGAYFDMMVYGRGRDHPARPDARWWTSGTSAAIMTFTGTFRAATSSRCFGLEQLGAAHRVFDETIEAL